MHETSYLNVCYLKYNQIYSNQNYEESWSNSVCKMYFFVTFFYNQATHSCNSNHLALWPDLNHPALVVKHTTKHKNILHPDPNSARILPMKKIKKHFIFFSSY